VALAIGCRCAATDYFVPSRGVGARSGSRCGRQRWAKEPGHGFGIGSPPPATGCRRICRGAGAYVVKSHVGAGCASLLLLPHASIQSGRQFFLHSRSTYAFFDPVRTPIFPSQQEYVCIFILWLLTIPIAPYRCCTYIRLRVLAAAGTTTYAYVRAAAFLVVMVWRVSGVIRNNCTYVAVVYVLSCRYRSIWSWVAACGRVRLGQLSEQRSATVAVSSKVFMDHARSDTIVRVRLRSRTRIVLTLFFLSMLPAAATFSFSFFYFLCIHMTVYYCVLLEKQNIDDA
jgi:hypothetical protein